MGLISSTNRSQHYRRHFAMLLWYSIGCEGQAAEVLGGIIFFGPS